MDLPGRPAGDADAVRAAAGAWDHLAWRIWHLSRSLEPHADDLARTWAGAAADAYATVWHQRRQAFDELDERIHRIAGQLRRTADATEDGQNGYDRTLEAMGFAAAAGIGLTVLTLGGSDAAAAEADGALATTAGAIIADLEMTLAREAALLSESAEALRGLASRFAVNFAMRGPDFAFSPAGGAAISTGIALASGVRDPGDLAASGLLGAAEDVGGGRRGGGSQPDEAEGEIPIAPPIRTPDPIEDAWNASLSTRQRVRQALFDRTAAADADPTIFDTLKEPGTR
jgi:WXG100 family type VII secretion target